MDFDCNSYIQMVDHWGPAPDVVGHHAMRIVPSILVWMIQHTGCSIQMGFHILSGGAYILFGILLYGFFAKLILRPQLSLALCLLALAPHIAMRIPLQLVYQSCDILVYPLSLLMVMYSLQKRATAILIISLIAIGVRQNLFILGLLSLLYCLTQRFSVRTLLYTALLVASYAFAQYYYQATGTFVELLSPPEGYFTLSHLLWVLWDSKLLELFVPLLPFLLLFLKPLSQIVLKYWHVSLYVCITMGQPFLGYHLTGNNFARLALQGFWLFYVALALVWPRTRQQPFLVGFTLAYSFAVYFTWGIKQRIWMMVGLCVIMILYRAYNQNREKPLLAETVS